MSSSSSVIRSGNPITPLPIGPGGNNSIKKDMNDIHARLTVMSTQAVENSKYDPATPAPITRPIIVEKFTTPSVPTAFAVIGILVFVYGLVRK